MRSMAWILVNLWIDEQTQFNLVLALGAGVYEELIFRAIGYGLVPYAILMLFRLPDLFKKGSEFRKSINTNVGFELKIFAAIVSSLLFSWLHNVSSFSLADYTTLYRFCMGLLFCLLFEIRGLGIAVWTHSLYDVFVFLLT